jgi:DNA polymerase I-like protein with 3'-5' exonuclease and polymerase domains
MSEWSPPSELPDLRYTGILALDLETKDGGLAADRGSGWPWGDGHVCGVSVAYRAEGTVRAHYFSLRHPDSQNFAPDQLRRWLQDLITADVRIVTQNGLYDWGWLRADLDLKMPPSERLEELGALATLIDENRRRYSLEALCAWRGLPGKDETLLRQAALALGMPNRKSAKPQAYVWQMPAHIAGPYAEADAVGTLAVFESLDPVLDQEGTRAAYRLEVDLLPMVHEMRRRGIRVDVAAAERARDQLLQKRDAAFAELGEKLGATVGMEEIGRTKWLAATFDTHRIKYPRTEKGNPSFTAGSTGWMHKHPHWLPQLIVKADKYNNAAVNFLETYILGHVINGRVHAEIHPHRSDEGGARSLRFSYSSPPLQLMPSRDKELAPLIRGVFLPEEGEIWAKPDVSQQEFRFIVHYAAKHRLRKADEAMERYRNDPNADFHDFAATMTGLERDAAKAVNFAKAFGAGPRKFAAMIGRLENEAVAIYDQYDRELPFVSQLSKMCERIARRQGYIELYDGARRHWTDWAPGGRWKKGLGPCSREEAERRRQDPNHPWYRRQLWRADTRKAMNALIQGSAARHTKLWMRACWREGIVPLLQLHDSLDCSVRSPDEAELVARLGREAVSLLVPMQVGVRYGCNWGDAQHTWDELHAPAQKSISVPQQAAEKPEPVIPLTMPESEPPRICIHCRRDPSDGLERISAYGGAWLHPDCEEALIRARMAEEGIAWDSPAPPAPAAVPTPPVIHTVTADEKIHCPFHDDKTPSCQLYADGHYHGCGAHGQIDEDLDVDASTLAQLAASAPQNGSRTLERALELWDASGPIADTLAARYLTSTRKLDLATLPTDIDAVLRFHPCCPFGPNGTRHPCLLALFRDVELNTPAGIHRIGLTPEGGKIKRLTLGRWPGPRAIKLWPAVDELVIGEGVETVLAAMHRGIVAAPAWAMGPKTDIATFPLLPNVKTLTILVDNDSGAPAGAKACATRWVAANHCVRLLTTKQVKDFNDLVMA